MSLGERIAPVLGACSAVATLACCLPVGGVAFLGIGGLFAAVGAYQQWLLPLSGVWLVLGGALIWRTRRVCHRTSKLSVGILVLSALIVALVWFFPQTVAGLLTNWAA